MQAPVKSLSATSATGAPFQVKQTTPSGVVYEEVSQEYKTYNQQNQTGSKKVAPSLSEFYNSTKTPSMYDTSKGFHTPPGSFNSLATPPGSYNSLATPPGSFNSLANQPGSYNSLTNPPGYPQPFVPMIGQNPLLQQQAALQQQQHEQQFRVNVGQQQQQAAVAAAGKMMVGKNVNMYAGAGSAAYWPT